MNREDIVALDRKLLWHPYTQMKAYIETTDPVVAARAEGFYLYDVDGTRYMDANGSWWTCIVGHNHPVLMAALVERTKTMVHCSFAGTTHEGAVRLAQRLLPLCGKTFSRLFFSDDGSTAVEVAIRMAAQFFSNRGQEDKRRFVTLSGAFHGETIGAASVSGVEVFHEALRGLLFDRIVLPSPAQSAAPDGEPWYETAFARAREILLAHHRHVAAVIVEPLVQGAAGMLMYPAAYLRELRALCAELDILLICDEVFTGYGRTGTFLAHAQAGVEADIVCLGKGFSGGELPMAATVTTERVFEAFLGDPSKTLWYGHSFTGNPLGCAVANATLDVFENERLMEQLPLKAAVVQRGLDGIASHPWVRAPRRTGIVAAFTLVDPQRPDDGGYLNDAGWRFYNEAKKRGALIRPLGSVVYFALPLTVTVAQIDELFCVVKESLTAAFG